MSSLEVPRPLLVRAANLVAGIAGRMGVRPLLEPDALLREARRRTGLTDAGEGPWVEGLARLCQSLQAEARLHPLGAWIVREQTVSHLVTRLRTQALLADHPEILDQELLPPVVVTGLQRTGTTKLQRLLASDPRARALLSWEALEPVPGTKDNRIAKGRRAEQALRLLNPTFFAIHPVEHDAPEEEVLLLDPTFHSTTPEAMCSVPSFGLWLESQDHRPAYEELRRHLLILQWKRDAQWWVLKTPHHLEHLPTLFQVMPEARLVWSHRDPVTTVGSFCSMLYHGRRLFSDAVDPLDVGAQWGRKVARMVAHGLAARDAAPDTAVLDVHYEDLLADPKAVVQRIHTFAGLPAADEAALDRALATQTQHRYGVHRYQLSDFALSREQIAEQFTDYRRRFGFEEPP